MSTTRQREIDVGATGLLGRIMADAVRRLGALLAAISVVMVLIQPVAGEQPRKAILLGINDIYQIEGIANGRVGGMARVRALRAEIERTAPDMLLLHAGDFLSPSFLGRTYAGAQMIDVMNLMDGNPARGTFDPRMFVAFGNHEFDDTNCGRPGPLPALIATSEFTWLASNLRFNRCEPLKPLATARNIVDARIVESGGLKIGLFAVSTSGPSYAAIVDDPVATACAKVETLRAAGADVVVALTHLDWQTDLAILGFGADLKPMAAAQRPCRQPPDLVFGGHDHISMALPSAAPRLFKADADAASAWVIEISKEDASLRIEGQLLPLDATRQPDPLVERVVGQWLTRHDERFCLADCLRQPREAHKTCMSGVENGVCLQRPIARASSPIETEEIANRSFETGFGNWLADQMRDAGKVDVAFINAGAIRINQNLPAGTMLTRRHLEQMFPYKSKLIVRRVPGKRLWRAMTRSLEARGEGAWAHFSGMAARIAASGADQRLAELRVRRQDNTFIEIGPDTETEVSVASLAFVFADGDGHGFELCARGSGLANCIAELEAAPAWPLPGDADQIEALMMARLSMLGAERGLELAVDRRVCERNRHNCLIDAWRKTP